MKQKRDRSGEVRIRKVSVILPLRGGNFRFTKHTQAPTPMLAFTEQIWAGRTAVTPARLLDFGCRAITQHMAGSQSKTGTSWLAGFHLASQLNRSCPSEQLGSLRAPAHARANSLAWFERKAQSRNPTRIDLCRLKWSKQVGGRVRERASRQTSESKSETEGRDSEYNIQGPESVIR